MNTDFIIMFLLSLAVVFLFTALIVFFLSMAEYKAERESKRIAYNRLLVHQLLVTLKS
jgi:hypothetical protein